MISGAVVRDGRLELPTSCSQSKRATNCANPGFLVIQFCSRCGQTCGQAFFLTISACGGSACIAGVSRNCGHSIFRLEVGATRSQSRRATNCATPGYFVILFGWSYSPKPGAIPTSLYPDIQFLPLYHGGEENQSFFCLWSFMWSKRRRRKALRRFASPYPGYRHGTPKPGAIPASLYPDMRVSADKHSAIIAKAAGECKHFLILKKN